MSLEASFAADWNLGFHFRNTDPAQECLEARLLAERIKCRAANQIALLKTHSNDSLTAMVKKNHQALAIGYRLHKSSKPDHWDVHIYDPNFPRTIQTLHYREDFRYQTEYGKDVKTGDFRAFFDVPYAPKRPYWIQ